MVRRKFGRDRFPPTTSNGLANAFPQVRPCFPASTGDHQRQPRPRVIVPLQRVKRRVSAGQRGRQPRGGQAARRHTDRSSGRAVRMTSRRASYGRVVGARGSDDVSPGQAHSLRRRADHAEGGWRTAGTPGVVDETPATISTSIPAPERGSQVGRHRRRLTRIGPDRRGRGRPAGPALQGVAGGSGGGTVRTPDH
jgi:hypothetical protein